MEPYVGKSVEPRSTTVKLGQAIETEIAMPVTVIRADGESVDPNDPQAIAAYMQKHVGILQTHVRRLDEDVERETALRSAAIDRLKSDVSVEHDRLRQTDQQVAISGLPLEMTGVFFVIAGTVMQGIAQLIK
jgi:hypothetical protein